MAKIEIVEGPSEFVEGNAINMGGGQIMDMPRGGSCHLWDAPGGITMSIEQDAYKRIGLLIYDPENNPNRDACPGGHGLAFLHQLTSDEARVIAYSLLKLAAQIDPVKH